MIEWTNEKRKLSDLIPWEENPRQINKKQAAHLQRSIREFGFAYPLLISPTNEILDGHQRQSVMHLMTEFGVDAVIDVRVASRKLTKAERKGLVARVHTNVGEWDIVKFVQLYKAEDGEQYGFSKKLLDKLRPGKVIDLEDGGAEVLGKTMTCPKCGFKWGVK